MNLIWLILGLQIYIQIKMEDKHLDCLTNEEYEKMLEDCLEGIPCNYGICDECPNANRNKNED